MGKKSKNVQKGKSEKRELQPVSKTMKVNLHKQCHYLINILLLIVKKLKNNNIIE